MKPKEGPWSAKLALYIDVDAAEFNKVIPRARGEAQQVIQEAEGYATDRVNRSQGDAALFDEVLAAW